MYEWFCDATTSVLQDVRPTLLSLRYEPEDSEDVPSDDSDDDDG